MKKVIDPKYFSAVCGLLAVSDCKSVIKVIDEKTIVKATWRFKPSSQNRREEMVVTMGEPDYRTRAFIKACKKANEPFPVKKPIIRHYPRKK